MVTRLSTNPAQSRLTSLISSITLPPSQPKASVLTHSLGPRHFAGLLGTTTDALAMTESHNNSTINVSWVSLLFF